MSGRDDLAPLGDWSPDPSECEEWELDFSRGKPSYERKVRRQLELGAPANTEEPEEEPPATTTAASEQLKASSDADAKAGTSTSEPPRNEPRYESRYTEPGPLPRNVFPYERSSSFLGFVPWEAHSFLGGEPPTDAAEWLREVARNPDVAAACAIYLGLDPDALDAGTNGVLGAWYEGRYRLLPEIRAVRAGRPLPLKGPELPRWHVRLLAEAGLIALSGVALPGLPTDAGDHLRAVYDGGTRRAVAQRRRLRRRS